MNDPTNLEDDLDLEGRLQDLFRSPALNLAPHPGAAPALLARAGRRRRRTLVVRTAGTVLTAAAITGLGLGAPSLIDPGERATVAQPAAAETVTPNEETMSRDGLGALRLGMPLDGALDTGLVADDGRPWSADPECRSYPGRRGATTVIIDDSGGVGAIVVNTFVKTPEGVGAGDTYEDLRSVYEYVPDRPRTRGDAQYLTVPVPGSADSRYLFFMEDERLSAGSRINSITMETTGSRCSVSGSATGGTATGGTVPGGRR